MHYAASRWFGCPKWRPSLNTPPSLLVSPCSNEGISLVLNTKPAQTTKEMCFFEVLRLTQLKVLMYSGHVWLRDWICEFKRRINPKYTPYEYSSCGKAIRGINFTAQLLWRLPKPSAFWVTVSLSAAKLQCYSELLCVFIRKRKWHRFTNWRHIHRFLALLNWTLNLTLRCSERLCVTHRKQCSREIPIELYLMPHRLCLSC